MLIFFPWSHLNVEEFDYLFCSSSWTGFGKLWNCGFAPFCILCICWSIWRRTMEQKKWGGVFFSYFGLKLSLLFGFIILLNFNQIYLLFKIAFFFLFISWFWKIWSSIGKFIRWLSVLSILSPTILCKNLSRW